MLFKNTLGNPLECTCHVLWLRAWYQETNSNPGPRCRDGNLLTDMRVSKSDCDSTNDSRLNQVLLTNEHGDIFKRQINLDECDMDHGYTENENIPSSPTDSEYFYEQYIDYPNNETVYEQAVGTINDQDLMNSNQSPFSQNSSVIQNDTLLNYNQYKLQQLHHNNNAGSSSFTFFGMPLPSLSNLWGNGNNARKSNSRADVDANGKSRLRNFRLRPGEIVDSFRYSNNVHLSPPPPPPPPFPIRYNTQPANIQPPPLPPQITPPPSKNNDPTINVNNYSFDNKHPSSFNTFYQPPYSDPKIEKGGFIPMLPPGRKGFTPIHNPYSNDTDDEFEDIQETVSTELKPNVNMKFDVESANDDEDNKYSVLVPTVSAESITQSTNFNGPSLQKDEITAPTKSSNGISLIRTSTVKSLIETIPIQNISNPFVSINRKNDKTNSKNIQKITAALTEPTHTPIPKPATDVINSPYIPTFMTNSSDVINLSKNKMSANATTNANPMISRHALSALVAPGAQQPYRTSPGRSVITKVFSNVTTNSTAPTTVHPTIQSFTSTRPIALQSTTYKTTKQPLSDSKLPTAEEYLRTTVRDSNNKENTTPITTNLNNSKSQTTNDFNYLNDQAAHKRDMEWYYNNYNKTTTWTEPQSDPGLHRFRSSKANILYENAHLTIMSIAVFLATCNLLFV